MIAFSTDAPIYHRPIGTIALIVLCVLGFFLVPWDPLNDPVPQVGGNQGVPNAARPDWRDEDFAVEGEEAAAPVQVRVFRGHRFQTLRLRVHSGTFSPWAWFTSPLLHDNPFELIVNMIALWAFGLVVEGKVGTRVFLFLFFAMAAAQACLFQVLLIFTSGIDLSGAGAGILGLMGISVVWAPKNNLDVWFGWWFGVHEVSILIYAFVQFAFAMLAMGLDSFAHLFGLGLGLCFGFIWLNRKWVDCEGWDLVSVMKNEHDKPNRTKREQAAEREAQALVRSSLENPDTRERKAKEYASVATGKKKKKEHATPSSQETATKKPNTESSKKVRAKMSSKSRWGLRTKPPEVPEEEIQLSPEARLELAQENVEELILNGNHATAQKLLQKLTDNGTPITLSQPALAKLMRDLVAEKDYEQAIPIMLEHIERFDVKRISLQLNLAKIYLHQERPKKALQILRDLKSQPMKTQEMELWRQLVANAKQQIEDGVIEISES